MRQGLTYFHETIFPSLPVFYRRIDTALAQIGQPKLPLDHNLFRFGSWMGGDRDGGCPLWQSLLCCLLNDWADRLLCSGSCARAGHDWQLHRHNAQSLHGCCAVKRCFGSVSC